MTERFIISAEGREGPVTATRSHPGSAIVLAMKWADLGYGQVSLTDGKGTAYDIPAFRSRFLRLRLAPA